MWIGTAALAGPAAGSGSGGCEEERTGEGQELVQSKSRVSREETKCKTP